MKKWFLGLLCLPLLLMGCTISTPNAEAVLEPVKYTGTVQTHVAQDLDLVWKPGQVYRSDGQLIPMTLTEAISAHFSQENIEASHPSDLTYNFGPARQAVVMTSIEQALIQNDVFKSVNLIPYGNPTNSAHTIMTVYFERTRVGTIDDRFPVIMTVLLTIQAPGQKVFQRHIFVESDDPGFKASSNIFLENQTNAANKLIEAIMRAIDAWSGQAS